ncbi:MAG TPA: DUF4230 domain-containing protein [Kiritimatiellia bacterium]|nr:DUF4230 domain-containing protein [Kiritimatiellia bacterium]HMO98479.1 DUF4230 domain-containing protein [Kiritimatiellia bacterium]HMP98046.1 DUF4230 domain-containing protein [Kiritimatiellia bacterium]
MNTIKEKIQRAKTLPHFRDLALLAAIIAGTLGIVMVPALALRYGSLKQAAGESEVLPVVDPLATLSETNVANALQHGMKARASKMANPCLVVGHNKGTIKNTRWDHSRFWGTLYVGVQAPYEAYYGYRLDIRSMPYRVERESNKIVIYLRPPSLLYRANVNLAEMRIYHVHTTRLRNDSDKDKVARRAQQPLTQMATEEALKKVMHSKQARVHAETVFRDILLDFVGQLDPALVQRFHDLIEIRFEKDPEVYADLFQKK